MVRRCEDVVKEAAPNLSQKQINDILFEADKLIKDNNFNDTAIANAIAQMSQNALTNARLEQRNRLINKRIEIKALDFLEKSYDDDITAGLSALLVGDNKATFGSRLSASNEQSSLSAKYLGGLGNELQQSGLFKLAESGVLDREIARYMFDGSSTNADAKKIGDMYRKWQEIAREDANNSGAYIKQRKDYITRQSHDPVAINKQGYDAWYDDVRNWLSDETFKDVAVQDRASFLQSVYTSLVSGVHLKPDVPIEVGKMPFTGSSNIAKSVSQDRVLHFKNGDAFYDYQLKYGNSNLMGSVAKNLNNLADSTGLMRILGTNPEAMIKKLGDRFIRKNKKYNPEVTKEINEGIKKPLQQLKTVDGSTRIPANELAASSFAAFRAVQSMAKLGGMLFSSFSDIFTYASEVKYQGGSTMQGVLEALNNIFKGRRTPEMQRHIASSGVAMDSLAGTMLDRFSTGRWWEKATQKGMRAFMRLTFMQYWTDAGRIGASVGASNRLFQEAQFNYRDIKGQTKRLLDMYQIQADEWAVLRKATETVDDTGLMTAEALARLDDSVIGEYALKKGYTVTNNIIKRMRDELDMKLRALITDRANTGLFTPDARTRALIEQGTQKGTIAGEMLRFIAQFKSFPLAVTQRLFGREWSGRQNNANYGINKFSESPIFGVARLITLMTMGGALAYQLKQISKGKEPIAMTEDNFKGLITASLLQGGGMGLYGDFLLADTNRYGNSLAESLFGVGVSSVAGIHQALSSDDDKAAKLTLQIINNVPFNNLFYTRPLLDYMLLYDLREMISPGYLRRMERRIKKENDQEFLLPPSRNTAGWLQDVAR